MYSYSILDHYPIESTENGPKYGKYLQGTKEFWFIYAHRNTLYEPPTHRDGTPLKLSYSQHFSIFQKQIMLRACAFLMDERCFARWEPLTFGQVTVMYQGIFDKLVRRPLREVFKAKYGDLNPRVLTTAPFPTIIHRAGETTPTGVSEQVTIQWPHLEEGSGVSVQACVNPHPPVEGVQVHQRGGEVDSGGIVVYPPF